MYLYIITLYLELIRGVNFNMSYMHLREWVNKLIAKCDCVTLLRVIVKIVSQRRSFVNYIWLFC